MNIVERIDDYGRPAWLGLMVVGFIIFWPVGLAILGYLLWSGRMGMGRNRGMGCASWGRSSFWRGGRNSFSEGRWQQPSGTSGNSAFDEYRAETLRRLEEEQREFFDFLDRLRQAKDKAEFDQFMAERRNRPAASPSTEPQQSA